MTVDQLKAKLKIANDTIDSLNSRQTLEQCESESFKNSLKAKIDEYTTEVMSKSINMTFFGDP